jgi:hypothetical protein
MSSRLSRTGVVRQLITGESGSLKEQFLLLLLIVVVSVGVMTVGLTMLVACRRGRGIRIRRTHRRRQHDCSRARTDHRGNLRDATAIESGRGVPLDSETRQATVEVRLASSRAEPAAPCARGGVDRQGSRGDRTGWATGLRCGSHGRSISTSLLRQSPEDASSLFCRGWVQQIIAVVHSVHAWPANTRRHGDRDKQGQSSRRGDRTDRVGTADGADGRERTVLHPHRGPDRRGVGRNGCSRAHAGVLRREGRARTSLASRVRSTSS